jgi:hypothetical protein
MDIRLELSAPGALVWLVGSYDGVIGWMVLPLDLCDCSCLLAAPVNSQAIRVRPVDVLPRTAPPEPGKPPARGNG